MPDVTLRGTGPLNDDVVERLEAEVAKALSMSMPCKLEYVIMNTASAQGKPKPMHQRKVTAHIVTGFLADKPENERRWTVKHIKLAVETAINEVMPAIHSAEAFVIDSIPPAKDST